MKMTIRIIIYVLFVGVWCGACKYLTGSVVPALIGCMGGLLCAVCEQYREIRNLENKFMKLIETMLEENKEEENK